MTRIFISTIFCLLFFNSAAAVENPFRLPISIVIDDDKPLSDDKSPMGVNVSSFISYTTATPLVNVFKAARPFNAKKEGYEVDENGWVKSLLPNQSAVTYMLWDIKNAFPTGHYTVIYDGKGRIQYGGNVKVVRRSPGRDVISVNAAKGGIQLIILDTSPDDYIRNIRVIMPGGTCENDPLTRVESKHACKDSPFSAFVDNYETQIFNPDYLKYLRPFNVLRFMDTNRTNDSPVENWSQRGKLSHATWSRDTGAPLEIMVELVNRTQKDPWFTLPHKADDDYVRQFAQYVKKHIHKDAKIYIEYSNEVWNGMFDQAKYVIEQGKKLGLNENDYTAGQLFYSQRAVEIFKIWEDVFGGTDRLVRVLASQSGNAWLSKIILRHDNAHKHADALAIAPYFGGYLGKADEKAAEMSSSELFKELSKNALPKAIKEMQEHAEYAEKFDVDLIAYEGGQHLAGIRGEENNKKLNDLFDKVNRMPQMEALYARYFDAWKKAGGKQFVYFNDTTRYSKWGRWGLVEHIYMRRKDSPKYRAVIDFIENNPRWW